MRFKRKNYSVFRVQGTDEGLDSFFSKIQISFARSSETEVHRVGDIHSNNNIFWNCSNGLYVPRPKRKNDFNFSEKCQFMGKNLRKYTMHVLPEAVIKGFVVKHRGNVKYYSFFRPKVHVAQILAVHFIFIDK